MVLLIVSSPLSFHPFTQVVKELHETLWENVCGLTPEQMIFSGFSDVIYDKVIGYLKKGEIENAAKQLDVYGLTKDHLMGHLTDCRLPFGADDEFKLLDSDVKRKLTKEMQRTDVYAKTEIGNDSKFKLKFKSPNGNVKLFGD
jgi:hypothetical protein